MKCMMLIANVEVDDAASLAPVVEALARALQPSASPSVGTLRVNVPLPAIADVNGHAVPALLAPSPEPRAPSKVYAYGAGQGEAGPQTESRDRVDGRRRRAWGWEQDRAGGPRSGGRRFRGHGRAARRGLRRNGVPDRPGVSEADGRGRTGTSEPRRVSRGSVK